MVKHTLQDDEKKVVRYGIYASGNDEKVWKLCHYEGTNSKRHGQVLRCWK